MPSRKVSKTVKFKGLGVAGIVAVVLAFVVLLGAVVCLNAWILMLLVGAVFPQWGVGFGTAVCGSLLLSVVGGFFKKVN